MKYTFLGLLAPMKKLPVVFWFVEGPSNADTYTFFFEYFVAPITSEGQIIFADNLSYHAKGSTAEYVSNLAEVMGGTYLLLPTYSPEYNPIELLWRWLERRLRSVPLEEDVLIATVNILSSLKLTDVINFYLECGWG